LIRIPARDLIYSVPIIAIPIAVDIASCQASKELASRHIYPEMPFLPPIDAFQAIFGSSGLSATLKPEAPGAPESLRSRYQAREDRYSAWSAKDDIKAKVASAGNAAADEFEKKSAAAQKKVGAIELYSPKYYASCTFGGLMACV
jgi:hypothetical protein